MKIKRWMVLTATFTLLGSALLVSGCKKEDIPGTGNVCGDVILCVGFSVVDFVYHAPSVLIKSCTKTCGEFDPFSVECNGDPIQYCFTCNC